MRAVAYIRASTDKQEASLAQQIKAIGEYGDREGYEIVEVFADEGVSGTSSERLGFCNLIRCCEDPRDKVRAVIIYDRSRWGRWLDHQDAIYWEQRLKHAGVSLLAVKGNNGDDIGGDITRMVESYGASEHSRKLSEVVRRGSKHNAERGNWNGGPAPYGYARMEYDPATGKDVRKLEKGQHKGSKTHRVRLVPGDELERKCVAIIFSARESGGTLQHIADWLNAHIHWGATSGPSGRKWSKQQVGNILRNKVYTGDITWADSGGKYEDSGETSGKKGAHDALIGG